MILNIAKSIWEYKATFKHPIQLILFCGEEQGLVGSKALALYYKKINMKIQLMINGDMLGYKVPGEPYQVAFNTVYTDPEATSYAKYVNKQFNSRLLDNISLNCREAKPRLAVLTIK